jgi:hypothetical protein
MNTMPATAAANSLSFGAFRSRKGGLAPRDSRASKAGRVVMAEMIVRVEA